MPWYLTATHNASTTIKASWYLDMRPKFECELNQLLCRILIEGCGWNCWHFRHNTLYLSITKTYDSFFFFQISSFFLNVNRERVIIVVSSKAEYFASISFSPNGYTCIRGFYQRANISTTCWHNGLLRAHSPA